MIPADMAALHALCFTTPRPWTAAEFTALAADPLCFVLTEPEAFLIGRAVAGEAELLTLAVAPQARRRGLGARLVQRFLYQARLRSAETAFLEVAAGNAPAIALYSGMGFARTGLRPGYYRSPGQAPADALILSRALG
jgi:ribosomal-protein-alanine N-acetyltransferase